MQLIEWNDYYKGNKENFDLMLPILKAFHGYYHDNRLREGAGHELIPLWFDLLEESLLKKD